MSEAASLIGRDLPELALTPLTGAKEGT
jgi:hypothetical protein